MKSFYISDFGIEANSLVDATPALKLALESASVCQEACEIIFDEGVYDVYLSELSSLDIHVSNTLSENDCQENNEQVSLERKTPFLLQKTSNITVDGCGAMIKCHGKMTQIILKECENVTFKNISFDYVNPTVTEMTVINCESNYIDCQISPSYPYKIVDGKIMWYGENFSFSKGISQLFDPKTGFTWRHWGPMDDENAIFEELDKGIIRLYFNSFSDTNNPYDAKCGYVFQMRDPTRDECGIIISECKNITFINVTMHFMSGLGFIAQNSDEIRLNGFSAFPSMGRTASCAADFMHFSGCRGKITIENGVFVGAHDDAVNVHGTHLKITEVDKQSNKIKLRFMHSQTYGIGGFYLGDEVGAIDPDTLSELAKTKITDVIELNSREILLTVESAEGFEPELMVENISSNAEVYINNNHFERIPTRGILITTRKPVVIENNEFVKVFGCGVLMADDARSWYESGHVTDVSIECNSYIACADSFVRIEPECKEVSDEFVHSGIKITNNLIEISNTNEVLFAKNTDGIAFKNNIMYGDFDDCKLTLVKVQNISMENNLYNGKEWPKHEKDFGSDA